MQILKDLDLHEGDHVVLKGHLKPNEGYVTKIAVSSDQHPHPPKVIFCNEKHKERAANPSDIEKVTEE
ncbi:hypothetical protein WJX72_010333 [[Myrmecia] bisecta]|uniref:Uncharacterized protein n=1 Tax=[Myrmecia] bisecta TaxID=41462 RepID=A0AAW1PAM6_9CHLO